VSSEALLNQTEQPALAAAQWLLESGIQDKGPDRSTAGGVNAWYDLKSASYSFIYGEITGYAVNAYLFFHAATGKDAYLAAARRAADWLLLNSYPSLPLVRNRVNQPGFQVSYYDNWVFSFDQWVIVYGLACLAQVLGSGPYLERARALADFLLGKTARPDGSFYPVYDVEKKTVEAKGDKWSRQSGGFHAKALMALEKLRALTGETKYGAAAEKLAAWTLGVQQKDGRFITQDNEGSTHLHPHIYTLEGLLSIGLAQNNKSWIDAAERGIRWVLQHQNTDGGVYSFVKDGNFVPFIRADILAQALRVGAALRQNGCLEGADNALQRLRQKLLSYQIVRGPQQGGFLYGQEQDGTIHYHVNAWVTMFAAQALAVADAGQADAYDMAFFV